MAEKEVIKSLEELLTGSHAHISFEDAVKDVPEKIRGVVPDNMPYSIWQLVEHIRIAQWDILEFSRHPGHQSPPWPEGYWPKDPAPKDDNAWKESIAQIKKDCAEFIKLLKRPDADLYAPFTHGDGQHLFREALLIADHTSYHTGRKKGIFSFRGDAGDRALIIVSNLLASLLLSRVIGENAFEKISKQLLDDIL